MLCLSPLECDLNVQVPRFWPAALFFEQNGTTGADTLKAAAVGADGSVVLAGATAGSWSGANLRGFSDFAAVKLDSGGKELWRWQVYFAVGIKDSRFSTQPSPQANYQIQQMSITGTNTFVVGQEQACPNRFVLRGNFQCRSECRW